MQHFEALKNDMFAYFSIRNTLMTKAQCVMAMFSTSSKDYNLKKAGISLKA